MFYINDWYIFEKHTIHTVQKVLTVKTVNNARKDKGHAHKEYLPESTSKTKSLKHLQELRPWTVFFHCHCSGQNTEIPERH